jgi:hypothetical protein
MTISISSLVNLSRSFTIILKIDGSLLWRPSRRSRMLMLDTFTMKFPLIIENWELHRILNFTSTLTFLEFMQP